MTGEYCYDNPNPHRWQKLKQDLNINVKDWNLNKGSYLLFCCSKRRRLEHGSTIVVQWILNTVTRVREHTDREIVIRFHPGDKHVRNHVRVLAKYRIKNLRLSRQTTMRDDFAGAYAIVNLNSSPIAGVIEGIPTFPKQMQYPASDVVHP